MWKFKENKRWESYHRVKLHTLSMGVKKIEQWPCLIATVESTVMHCCVMDRGPSVRSWSCFLLLSKHWMPLVFFWLKIVTYLHNTFLSIWLTVEGWKQHLMVAANQIWSFIYWIFLLKHLLVTCLIISKIQMRNQSCQSAAGEPQDEGHPGLHGRPIS